MVKDLGKKVLNGLKNSLEFFSGISLIKHGSSEKINEYRSLGKSSEENSNLYALVGMFKLLGPLIPLTYLSLGLSANTWTPKQYKEHLQRNVVYERKVEKDYKTILDSLSTKQDSINFYQENGLGKNIKLNDIPFKEKERIVKQK